MGFPPSRAHVVEICHLDVTNGSWPFPSARLKKANLANLANLANISGTERGAIFAGGSRVGSERPGPLTSGDVLLGRGDTRLAGRIEGLLADFMGCGLVKSPHGLDHVVESVIPQRRSQSCLIGE